MATLLVCCPFFETHCLRGEGDGTHSSALAWKTPWMEEPDGLQSMESRRVGHDRATSLSLFTFMHWRRKWQPTPVFLPGESQGRGSLVGCHLWGHTESDTTEATQQQQPKRNRTTVRKYKYPDLSLLPSSSPWQVVFIGWTQPNARGYRLEIAAARTQNRKENGFERQRTRNNHKFPTPPSVPSLLPAH